MATKLGRTRRMARKLINSPKALASSRYVFLSFLNSYFLIVVGVFGRLLGCLWPVACPHYVPAALFENSNPLVTEKILGVPRMRSSP